MFGRRAAMALVVAVGLAAAACAPRSQPPTGAGSGASTGTGGGPTVYPLVMDNCGQDYTFTAPPSRVVVMNGGSVAEVSSLLALGLGDRIVANAQSYGASEEPGRAEEIAALPTGGIELNELLDIPREAMLGLRPDFVISTWGGGFDAQSGFATREELRGVGANTYVPVSTCGDANSLEGGQTIADSYALLRDLGRIFDASDRAEAIIAGSERKVAEVAAKVAGKPAPRVMVIIPGMEMGSGDFSSIAANGIWNDIIAKAGGVNAFAGTTDGLFANLSREQVAATPVDAVVIVSFANPDPAADAARLFAAFPQWEAAARDRFVVLSDSIYLGPNNAVAVDRIARMIHPDAF